MITTVMKIKEADYNHANQWNTNTYLCYETGELRQT